MAPSPDWRLRGSTGFALRLQHNLGPLSAADGIEPAARESPSSEADGADTPHDHAQPLELPAPRCSTIDGVRLTSRQLQVILLACEGLRHNDIGACLGIGAAQVRRHLEKARERTGSASTPQLIAWAYRKGLVPRRP